MSVRVIEVESPFGVTVRNRFEYHEPQSDRLMIILPGRGYTVHYPALLHLGHMASVLGYDVLPVQYGFHVMDADFDFDQMPLVQQDVESATKPVLAQGYREVCVVGKSMGTPLAITLAQSVEAEQVSQILLTPIGPAMQVSGDIRTLAIIGTADPNYSPELTQTDRDNVTWRVFDRLNHGFIDDNDWRYSVDCLKAILETCAAFLEGK